eukprot:jgi/Chrzof1/4115/UNPLg00779.t1
MLCCRWNVSKVLGLSFWKELGKFVLISTTPLILRYSYNLGQDLCVMAHQAQAALYRLQEQARSSEYLLHTGVEDRLESLFKKIPAVSDGEDVLSLNSGSCTTDVWVVIIWYMFCFVCWVLYGWYVGKRRSQIKARLGITRNDDCCNDCCLHMWCPFCALAQETRTILHLEKTGRFISVAHAAAAAKDMRVPVTDDMERAGKAT